MAANLFGERFVGNRKPAWHELGKVFEGNIKATEAIHLADLDYHIITAPLVANVDGQVCKTEKYGIFREPTPDDPKYNYFGICSKNYSVLQNYELAKIIDGLTEEWPVETAGALGDGETIFMSLDAGHDTIRGEDIRKFFLITDTRDGGTSMKISFTPVRVVCQNTLVSGLRQATVSATIMHDSSMEDILKTRVKLLNNMQSAMSSTMKMFEHLANKAVIEHEINEIINAAYPMPNKPKSVALLDEYPTTDEQALLGVLNDRAQNALQSWEYACGRVDAFRDGAMYNYERICDEHNSIANTAWAAYNAVVEFADFRAGTDSVPASTLFGNRALEKKRAFKKAVAIAS